MCNPTIKPYPIYLTNLADRHCIVIGGGHEAEGKVRGLLDVEATITVIHPTLTDTLRDWAANGRFTWLQRDYQTGDLKNAFLVIAERADPAQNAAIWEEATAEKALVNVMDDVEHCNFVAGSVIRRGKLVLSISTSGAAPAFSVRLRQRFEQEFGDVYELFLDWMMALRPVMKETYPGFGGRKRRWYELVDGELLALLENGRFAEARNLVAEVTGLSSLPEIIEQTAAISDVEETKTADLTPSLP